MRIQTLFVTVVICVLAGSLQARSLSHKVGGPIAISPKDHDFLPVDAFVHAEHPELKQARLSLWSSCKQKSTPTRSCTRTSPTSTMWLQWTTETRSTTRFGLPASQPDRDLSDQSLAAMLTTLLMTIVLFQEQRNIGFKAFYFRDQ